MRRIFNYFFQGLLLIGPLVLTVWILVHAIIWFDELIPIRIPVHIPGWEPFDLPGAGILAIFISLTVLGFFANKVFPIPLLAIINNFFERSPLTKIVYTSLRELIEAFVGEKKRFNKPVRVLVNIDPPIERIGFITQSDLSSLGISENKVAVYIPFSYSVSGIVIIVPSDKVSEIHGSGTNAMKFAISGGVTEIDTGLK